MEKKATWIWYPADFEVWLGNQFNNRRTERGAMFPPFWKQDSHWPTVVFDTLVNLPEDEEIEVFCEGRYNISIDGRLTTRPIIPRGEHRLSLKVWNQLSPPAIFIDSKNVKTGSGWKVSYEDKIWIDEQGVAHESGIYVPAASWNFNTPSAPPSSFRLPTKPVSPVCCDGITTSAALYDFGRETFGYLRFHGLRGTGLLRIYYGESREEALDRDHCETLDIFTVSQEEALGVCPVSRSSSKALLQSTSPDSKAFRYVLVEKDGTVDFDRLTMDEEYAPFDPTKSGSFRCSDDELNRIWEVSARTLDLTTREFFCDGIKRDRWTWSGDAIQSYLMNYYLRFDTECAKRTIRQLRGKDPVTAHVNTIMDYTFYWFVSIWHYYEYTGDLAFLSEMWPKMVTLMDFALSRTNADGMAEGKASDWIFVDWTDFPMHKRGILAFEQILLWKALQTMAQCAARLPRADSSPDSAARLPRADSLPYSAARFPRADSLPDYAALASSLRERIRISFWNADGHAYLHAIEYGRLNSQLTKFPNMFAILYGLAPDSEKPLIAKHVLLNPDVPPITTPYMRFYELEALCQMGLHDEVLRQMKDYWGGMLRLGATTFWEKYDPTVGTGAVPAHTSHELAHTGPVPARTSPEPARTGPEPGPEHLAMYGRPYGKSLCHAWGASPLYLIGKYFLGVRPTKPGYEEYEVRPMLGGLDWMEGDVPTPFGKIHVRIDSTSVTVRSNGGKGRLIAFGKDIPIPANTTVKIENA